MNPSATAMTPGGNRRVNALHRIAVSQLRCEPRAQALYANAAPAATPIEARRILKRHLSDVIHRHMLRNLNNTTPLTKELRFAACGGATGRGVPSLCSL